MAHTLGNVDRVFLDRTLVSTLLWASLAALTLAVAGAALDDAVRLPVTLSLLTVLALVAWAAGVLFPLVERSRPNLAPPSLAIDLSALVIMLALLVALGVDRELRDGADGVLALGRWLGIAAPVGIAFAFLIAGRARRVGRRMFCSRCGYERQPENWRDPRANIQRCPECNEEWTRRGGFVRGELVHRPVLVLIGAALLAFDALAMSAIWASSVSPTAPTIITRLTPTAALITDAKGTDDAATRAISEITLRRTLTQPQRDDLAGSFIRRIITQLPAPLQEAQSAWLDKITRSGALSPALEETYWISRATWDGSAPPSLIVTPTSVRANAPITVGLDMHGSASSEAPGHGARLYFMGYFIDAAPLALLDPASLERDRTFDAAPSLPGAQDAGVLPSADAFTESLIDNISSALLDPDLAEQDLTLGLSLNLSDTPALRREASPHKNPMARVQRDRPGTYLVKAVFWLVVTPDPAYSLPLPRRGEELSEELPFPTLWSKRYELSQTITIAP